MMKLARTAKIFSVIRRQYSLTAQKPGFPVKSGGVDKLHAAFLNESRTRGRLLSPRTGNPGSACANPLLPWSWQEYTMAEALIPEVSLQAQSAAEPHRDAVPAKEVKRRRGAARCG
jgi:hypothetical protein